MLLQGIYDQLDNSLSDYPPSHDGALTPVNYNGFRWGTQLDPLWNLFFLSLVLEAASQIEAERINIADKKVFSYRYNWNEENKEIFDRRYNWHQFMERSLELSKVYSHIVVCDVSEFYPRLGHHRIDNALRQLNLNNGLNTKIMKFLRNFSGTNSFGLPVGGPAARLLSELALDQIDQLLRLEGIEFCRYADDFHLFCKSTDECYTNLLFLSEKLHRNQGLQLQKSKTRVMSSEEFNATNPLRFDNHDDVDTQRTDSALQSEARSLLRFSLKFDPYSQTADEDYEQLKAAISKFDIMGILQSELSKSRVHIAVARKIVSAIKYLPSQQQDLAVISLIGNSELLYPIFSNVLSVAKTLFEDLGKTAQDSIITMIVDLINNGSHVLRAELNLSYAVRLLGCKLTSSTEETLARLFSKASSTPLIRKDIILIMAKWHSWEWLSDLRSKFRNMSASERRSFIIASYSLNDEGDHWRKHVARELSPFELLIKKWAEDRHKQTGWKIPI